MSRNNSNKRYTKSQIEARIAAKRKAKRLAMQKHVAIFTLLALLVLGLVSTSFASFITPAQTGESGSLIASITSNAVKQGSKDHIADTKANVDVADTSAVTFTSDDVLFFNMKAVSWWTAGTDGNGNFAYFFNNSTGAKAWSAHAVKYSGDIYYVKIPAGTWEGVILTRNNTSTAPTWDNKWNQTGDIVVSSSSNYLSSFSENSASVTWGTQKPTSNGNLTTNNSTINVGVSEKLIPSLTTNTTYNEIKSTSYSISPSTGASISGNNFTATAAGTYTITATITYNPRGYSNLTSTVTASTTITVNDPKYTYTVTANTGGSVSPKSGSVIAGESVSITATPNTGYTFAGWSNASNGSVASTTSATTNFTPTANNATVKANFRPNTPSALTFTGNSVASGTSGDGTQANPFIVFENGGFTLVANATVPTGASKYYATTSPTVNSNYKTSNTFTPALDTKGLVQTYTVYAKAYAGGYYSTNYLTGKAYYLVFSHLDGANTGFTMSSDSITDADSVTFSATEITGIANAEKTYIEQTYQVSTDNSIFTDISGNTWSPDSVGTYYFRIKTTNTKTGETVYSVSQTVTVSQSTVYYDITVVKASGSGAGTATLKTNNTTITDNKILSNEALTLSLTRSNATPSNYYFTYIRVTDGSTSWNVTNLNGNLADTVVIDHVKGDVTIEYHTAVKPLVQPDIPTNAASISFKYKSDGVDKTVTTGGNYYVDYNSNISYAVTPKTGYYVSDMTDNVTMGTITSSTVTGTKNSVTANLGRVSATLTANNTVTVNVDITSALTDGASMTVDGAPVAFGTPKALNYGTESTVIITAPDNCYALVSGNGITAAIGTDGKSTFKVTLTGQSKTYTVKFVENPKIYMVQPQYGSVYVTDDAGNYYFNGDSVGYGTKLTVHVKPDHANAKLNSVLVNDASIGVVDGSTFLIKADSTATANITVSSDFAFTNNTAYGTRRIFFTDTCSWGNSNASNVLVHYSNTVNDTNFSSNNIVMTRKYYNEYSQYVYYADIPFSAKYVTFVNNADKTQYSTQGTIANTNNAYYMGNTGNYPRAISSWVFNYSDYVAKDRAETIQQATTSKGEAATFQYTCDFGDDTLSAEVVSGNDATFDFDKGTLSITPTENSEPYTLVKVSSAASTTVKYYLIRVESFEIYSFGGLQKIYSTSVFNKIQLDLIVKGGALNYAAKYFVSDTNAGNSYSEITDGKSSGFSKVDSLEGYINSFLVEYNINTVSGVKYFKSEATDAAGRKATSTAKTLFGTNNYKGERALYFYNDTNVDMSKFNLRACFKDVSDNNITFVTMQKVGDTDYYRAVIPKKAQGKVSFYLCNKKTFSNNYADYDGTDDSTDIYSFSVINQMIPDADSSNIVYKASTIDNNGINGDFVDFDY